MKNKYNLTKEQNIFLAKKKLIENIYSGARVEGLNVTYPETQAIVDGINVAHLSIDDILVIRNLKNAWKFVLENIEKETDLDFLLRINEDVSRGESLDWGRLRTGQAGISGTNYLPPIPEENNVRECIQKIIDKNFSDTEKAIELYMYCCKSQLFWDGNKRTAFIFANKYLISKGCGLLSIKDEDILSFNVKLTDYYQEEEKKQILKEFLYNKCITGIVVNSKAVKTEEDILE